MHTSPRLRVLVCVCVLGSFLMYVGLWIENTSQDTEQFNATDLCAALYGARPPTTTPRQLPVSASKFLKCCRPRNMTEMELNLHGRRQDSIPLYFWAGRWSLDEPPCAFTPSTPKASGLSPGRVSCEESFSAVNWILSFPRIWQTAFPRAAPFSSPPAASKGSGLTPTSRALTAVPVSYFRHSDRCGVMSHCGLTCIPLSNDHERLLLCFFATSLSWWPIYIFWHFLIGLFPSYCWIWGVLCISFR